MSTEYSEAHEEFVNELRNILSDEECDTSDVFNYILDALRGDVDAGDISDLIHDRYVTEKIKQGVEIKAQQLAEQNQRKLRAAQAEIENQFEKRVQTACELQGIYGVVRDKLMSDPSFLGYAISQIQSDIRRSKTNGEYPFLYKMTLEHCDEKQFIAALIKEYGDSLLVEYRNQLKDQLLQAHRQDLIEELRKELRHDERILEQLRSEIKNELVKTMFS